jgi:hypothetical protein
MDLSEFKQTLKENGPPKDVGQELAALWIEANGDWDKAHSIVQVMENWQAEWVHAYLHRKEPDLWNANYWYNRCGKPMPEKGFSFDREWDQIAEYLLDNK